MALQPADGGRLCTADRAATPPNLDLLPWHVQAWLEQTVSVRGMFGVLVVAILALLTASAWKTCCPVRIDSVAVEHYRTSGPVSHLFEAGAPGHAVTAIQYKLVSD